MFKWLRKKLGWPVFDDEVVTVDADQASDNPAPRHGLFSTDIEGDVPGYDMAAHLATVLQHLPRPAAVEPGAEGVAMDAADNDCDNFSGKRRMSMNQPNVSDALSMWYARTGFIGHQLAAMVSQHWLVNKACTMPAEDAIRKGFTITSADGDDIPPNIVKATNRADKKYNLMGNMLQFIRMGRIFGVRIVIFKIDSADPKFYEQPFNLDGVTAGSYRGMVQIDPYWCAPELDGDASSQPDTMHFYEPTYWLINGKRYHRSHLIIFRNCELPDLLKPSYLYGGIPVPQQIMERVYGAERTANEAPLLALSKRTTIYKTDLAKALANWDKFKANVARWSRFWNNNGIRVIGEDEEVTQTDTALADLDTIIMTQFQLVAAAANVPGTKLMGTAPKGFNATGEFDESSYHEYLESLQTHHLTPLAERHHAIVKKSDIDPVIPEAVELALAVNWNPLDSPTAKERADTDLVDAQTGAALIASGAIDHIDERERIRQDKDGKYAGIDAVERPTGAQ